MPAQPSASDLHVNGLLTDLSVAFVQDASKFVAGQVFPRVTVPKQTDKYATYDRGDFLRDEMQLRGDASESAGTGYTVSSDPFHCEVYAIHKDVSDRQRANADSIFQPDRDAVQYLVQKRLIKQDVLFVSKYLTTGVWTGSTTGTDLVVNTDFTPWDDAASTPVEDVQNQQESIEGQTGLLANTLVVRRDGWNALKNHPDIVDRVKHTSDGPVTTGIVARLMDLDRIVIAAAVQNTAQEGLAGSYGYIADNDALLCYSAPSPSPMQPSAGYIFEWNEIPGISAAGNTVSSFRMEELKSDRIELETAFDMKVVSSVLGAYFNEVTS